MDEIKYQAIYTCHTSAGQTPCCEDHARKLLALYDFMGCNVVFELIPSCKDIECAICNNEENK
jgi:hypothetical protein